MFQWTYQLYFMSDERLTHISLASLVHLLLVALDEGVEHFVGVGEHAVGEEEGGGEVRVRRVGEL